MVNKYYILLLLLLIPLASAYNITGNSVYETLPGKATIMTTPHTAYSSNGWYTQEFNFTNEMGVGFDADIALAFNQELQGGQVWLLNYATFGNGTKYSYYTDVTSAFTKKTNSEVLGFEKLFVRENIHFNAGETKSIKVRYKPLTENGKFSVFMKPTSKTVSQAITDGTYILLDPWYAKWSASLGVGSVTTITFNNSDISGGTSLDISDGNDFTNNGVTTGQVGKFGESYYFDGNNDYVYINSVPSNLQFAAIDDLSWGIWLKRNGNPAAVEYPFKLGERATDGAIQIVLLTTGKVWCQLTTNTGSNLFVESTLTVTNNNWHYVACTYNGTSDHTLQIYVDGYANATTSCLGCLDNFYSANAKTVIGAAYQHSNTSYIFDFNGYLDEFNIFNYTLSHTDISNLYNNNGVYETVPRAYDCVTNSSGNFTNSSIWNCSGIAHVPNSTSSFAVGHNIYHTNGILNGTQMYINSTGMLNITGVTLNLTQNTTIDGILYITNSDIYFANITNNGYVYIDPSIVNISGDFNCTNTTIFRDSEFNFNGGNLNLLPACNFTAYNNTMWFNDSTTSLVNIYSVVWTNFTNNTMTNADNYTLHSGASNISFYHNFIINNNNAFLLGDATNVNITFNDIYNQTTTSLYNISTGATTWLNATYNYWGSTICIDINSEVYNFDIDYLNPILNESWSNPTATKINCYASLVKCGGAISNTTVLNYSFFDELNLSTPIYSDMEMNLDLYSLGLLSGVQSFNWTNVTYADICIYPTNGTYNAYSFQDYRSFDGNYPQRSYFLRNATLQASTPYNINLYLLNSSYATMVIGTKLYNEYRLGVESSYIYFNRYYPALNEYRTVAMIKTDQYGLGNTYLQPNTAWYRIIASDQSGTILESFTPQTITCDPLSSYCSLNLYINPSAQGEYWTYQNNFAVDNCPFNNVTNTTVCTYSDSSGVMRYARLRVLRVANNGATTTVCDVNSTSISGVLSCYLGNVTGNKYLIKVTAHFFDEVPIFDAFIEFITEITFGISGVFAALMIVLVSALAFIWSLKLTVIAAIIGLLLSGAIGLISLTQSAAISFVVIGLVILYVVGGRK